MDSSQMNNSSIYEPLCTVLLLVINASYFFLLLFYFLLIYFQFWYSFIFFLVFCTIATSAESGAAMYYATQSNPMTGIENSFMAESSNKQGKNVLYNR